MPTLKSALKKLSGKRGSNPRPLAWEANALPTELLPLIIERVWDPPQADYQVSYFRFLVDTSPQTIYETDFANEILFATQLSFNGMIQFFSNSSFDCTRLLK